MSAIGRKSDIHRERKEASAFCTSIPQADLPLPARTCRSVKRQKLSFKSAFSLPVNDIYKLRPCHAAATARYLQLLVVPKMAAITRSLAVWCTM